MSAAEAWIEDSGVSRAAIVDAMTRVWVARLTERA
jgi:hypothetical protein